MGNNYITGNFADTVGFDPGSGEASLSSAGSDDIFVAKYGPSNGLRVDLLSFTAKPANSGEAVQVDWSTASETNNAFFEVERSKDGDRFEALGRRQGCLTCTGLQRYEWTDNNPYSGLSYYRLKQVDQDDTFSYSPTELVSLATSENTKLGVYPN